MAWQRLDPRLREIAERVLTAKQLDALKMLAAGSSHRKGAAYLGISVETYRGHLTAARRKILEECERQGLRASDLLEGLR